MTGHRDQEESSRPTRDPDSERLAAWRSLTVTHAQLRRRLGRALAARGIGLSLSDVVLIDTVASDPGRTLSELAAASGLSQAGATQVVRRLVRRGLVEAVGDVDRRVTHLHLLPEGRRLVRLAQDVVAAELPQELGSAGPALVRLRDRITDGA